MPKDLADDNNSEASTIIPEDDVDMNDEADDASTVIPDEEENGEMNNAVADEIIAPLEHEHLIDEEVVVQNDIVAPLEHEHLIDEEVVVQNEAAVIDVAEEEMIWNIATVVVPPLDVITNEDAQMRWQRVSAENPAVNELWKPKDGMTFPPLPSTKNLHTSSSAAFGVIDVVSAFAVPATAASASSSIPSSVDSQELGIHLLAINAANLTVDQLVDDNQQGSHEQSCAYHLFPSRCNCKSIPWIRARKVGKIDDYTIELSSTGPTHFYSDLVDGSAGGGKWLLNPKFEHVDLTWFILLNLLAAHRLGDEIKISQTNRSKPQPCVICVSTSSSALEIARVLHVLRTSGLPCAATDLLSWKAESTTEAGQYSGGKINDTYPSYMVSSFISEKVNEIDGQRVTTLDRCNYTSNYLRIRIAEIKLNDPESSITLLDPPTYPRYKTSASGRWLQWSEGVNDKGQPSPKRARKKE